MVEKVQEEQIDDIIKSIREAIVEKERKKYFSSFYDELPRHESDVYELSKSMLVKREDVPYQLGVWSFDDVAKKMLKKYRKYFQSIKQNDNAELESHSA